MGAERAEEAGRRPETEGDFGMTTATAPRNEWIRARRPATPGSASTRSSAGAAGGRALPSSRCVERSATDLDAWAAGSVASRWRQREH